MNKLPIRPEAIRAAANAMSAIPGRALEWDLYAEQAIIAFCEAEGLTVEENYVTGRFTEQRLVGDWHNVKERR